MVMPRLLIVVLLLRLTRVIGTSSNSTLRRLTSIGVPGFLAEFFNLPAGHIEVPKGTDNSFGYRTPDQTRVDLQVDYPSDPTWPAGFTSNFGVRWSADFEITSAGTYSFRLTSADGSILKLDDLSVSTGAGIVVNNDFVHASTAATADIALTAGVHLLQLEYFVGTSTPSMKLEYSGPDTSSSFALITSSACTTRISDHQPIMTLNGLTTGFYQKATSDPWSTVDPSGDCTDETDGMLFITLDPAIPDISVAGTINLEYRCTDSSGHITTAIREIIVRSAPVLEMIGAVSMSFPVGGLLMDPGSCCSDFEGNDTITLGSSGGVDTGMTGKGAYSYWCTDDFTAEEVTLTRELVVDAMPSVLLIGDAEIQNVRGIAYSDTGIMCVDGEDGEVSSRYSEYAEKLKVTEVTTSMNDDIVHTVTDDKTYCDCNSCISVTGSDPKRIRLDLGDTRLVNRIEFYGPSALTGLDVRVGSAVVADGITFPSDEPFCVQSATTTANAWSTLTCSAPVAGRYVNVYLSGADLEANEIEVWGSAGPVSPSQFDLNVSGSDCTDISGLFSISGGVNGFPTYKGPQQLPATVKRVKAKPQMVTTDAGGNAMDVVDYDTVESASQVYSDDSTILFQSPGDFGLNCMYVRGPNADATTADSAVQWTLTIDMPSIVYLGFKDATQASSTGFNTWGTSWTASGKTGATWGDMSGPGVVYQKKFAAGTVQLMGNAGGGTHDSYTVFVCGQVTDVWTLTKGTGAAEETLAYGYSGGTLPSLTASTWTIKTGVTCSIDVFQFYPNDACTWLYGASSSPTQWQCADGTFASSGSGCSSNGGVARCPASAAQMCSTNACNADCVGLGMGTTLKTCYDSAAVNCMAANTIYSPDMVAPTTETDVAQCQNKCKQTSNCAYFSFDAGAGSDNCHLHASGSTFTAQGSVTAGPVSCIPRYETRGIIDKDTAATYYLYYGCVDSFGQRSGSSREVVIGCEGPNPEGVYGGNKVVCAGNAQADRNDLTTFELCTAACLDIIDCEAVDFEPLLVPPVCQLLKTCDGDYYRDGLFIDKQVGYCLRIDHPPTVVLEPTACCVNVDSGWTETAYSCTDYEDNTPPTAVATHNFPYPLDQNSPVQDVPGFYQVTYTCTDSNGGVTSAIRNVTVRSRCGPPEGINDTDAAGPCVEGNIQFDYGAICTGRCGIGFYPQPATITCGQPGTEWESQWEQLYICGEQMCVAPDVADTVDDTSCAQGPYVVSGQPCTTNCIGGAWPDFMAYTEDSLAVETELSCYLGVLTPPSYVCLHPAGQPPYILFGDLYVQWVEVAWAAGESYQCVFDKWVVQKRVKAPLTEFGNYSDWSSVVGCEHDRAEVPATAPRADASRLTCNATDLMEGYTYEFRVREECDDMTFRSQWRNSVDVTTLVVEIPSIFFKIPEEDVIANPQQIMIAFTVDVVKNFRDDINWTVTKVGEFCDDGVWPVSANDLSEAAQDGPGVEVIAFRFLIAQPDTTFFQPGCFYNITMEPGYLKTRMYPSKWALPLNWNFTYIDLAPVLVMFTVEAGSITKDYADFKIMWSLNSFYNCTASPVDQAGCEAIAVNSISPTNGTMCIPHGANGDTEMVYADPTNTQDFYIHDMYPGLDYNVDCSGCKLDGIVRKWWILTEPILNVFPVSTFRLTTLKDTDKAISPEMYLNVTCICANGEEVITRQETLVPSEIGIGYTAQVMDWRVSCLNPPGKKLVTGQEAYMLLTTNIKANSKHARFTWNKGPDVNFTYIEPAEDIVILEEPIEFEICPLEFNYDPTMHPCVVYTLVMRIVNIAFNLTGSIEYAPGNGSRRLVEEAEEPVDFLDDPTGRILTGGSIFYPPPFDSAQWITVNCLVSQETFDWSEVTVYLGMPLVGFVCPHTYDNVAKVITFRVLGTGTTQPLMFFWRSATFKFDYRLSLTPPTMTFTSELYLLHAQKQLTVTFGNVPTPAILAEHGYGPGLANPWPNGFSVARAMEYISIVVMKAGNDEDLDNMCGPTSFTDTYGWGRGSCIVSPGPLKNVTVKLKIYDYGTEMQHSIDSTALVDKVVFAQHTHEDIIDEDVELAKVATNGMGVLDVGLLINRTAPFFYVMGVDLPAVSNLEMAGAVLSGYQLDTLGTTDDVRQSMCSDILHNAPTNLTCILTGCVNFSNYAREPPLLLRLGDLDAADRVEGKLSFPRPQIYDFGPRAIYDVGPARTFWFTGMYFGELLCPTDPTAVYGTTLVGSAFGANITIGEFASPCPVTFQNDTYLECVQDGPIMEQRRTPIRDQAVPRPRLSVTVPMTFNLGEALQALNFELVGNLGNMLSEHEDLADIMPTLQMAVQMKPCDDGTRRPIPTADECVPCGTGRWSTQLNVDWPLTCEACPEGRYQDEAGGTACKACPLNTWTQVTGSNTIVDCTCKPGFYSPYLNKTTCGDLNVDCFTIPGTPCKSCSGAEATDVPLAMGIYRELCGFNLLNDDRCDALVTDTCVNVPPPAVNHRICKAACPGGTAWPKAKNSFWLLENIKDGVGEAGLTKWEPVFLRCDPPQSCLTHNSCFEQYTGEACAECVFGFWRDPATNYCEPCGQQQVIGMIMMSAFSVIMSIGALFGASFFIRIKGDHQFMYNMANAGVYVAQACAKRGKELSSGGKSNDGVPGGNAKCGCRCGKGEARNVVEIDLRDAGKSMHFARDRDLGMVFRVDSRNVIHLCGTMMDSPMVGKVQMGWKLQTVNGRRLVCRTEEDVQEAIQNAKFPMRFVFTAKRLTRKQREIEEKGLTQKINFREDRKSFLVLVGVMNAFHAISMFDFQWPPLFLAIAAFAARFSFSLNFFKPECSVETPFIQKWLMMLSIPYFMMFPLTLSWRIARFVTLTGEKIKVARETKSWMLRNAYCRCVCVSCVLLVPAHMDQLLIPLACIERGEGMAFVADWPETQCTFADKNYRLMIQIAGFGFCVLSFFYSLVLYCLWMSFNWHFGNRRRDQIPFYVSAVEVSTFGQRGSHDAPMERVYSNITALKAFDPNMHGSADLREKLTHAVDKVGDRSRRVKADKVHYGAGIDLAGQTENDSIQDQLERMQKTLRFRHPLRWPDKPDGNVVTFGWILIVNLLFRQMCTLIVIKKTEGNLVVVGAFCQMLVFAVNITVLMIFKPYKYAKVNRMESGLLSALFCILWAAVLKELLTGHVNAHLYINLIERAARLIEVLAVLLISLVIGIPVLMLWQLIQKIMLFVASPDATLNLMYWKMHLNKHAEEDEELMALKGIMQQKEDGENDPAHILAKGMPVLSEAMRRFDMFGEKMGMERPNEVQQARLLKRLAQTVQNATEARIQQLNMSTAIEHVQKESEKAKKQAEQRERIRLEQELKAKKRKLFQLRAQHREADSNQARLSWRAGGTREFTSEMEAPDAEKQEQRFKSKEEQALSDEVDQLAADLSKTVQVERASRLSRSSLKSARTDQLGTLAEEGETEDHEGKAKHEHDEDADHWLGDLGGLVLTKSEMEVEEVEDGDFEEEEFDEAEAGSEVEELEDVEDDIEEDGEAEVEDIDEEGAEDVQK